MFQSCKAADEMGGVSRAEFGDNQHAESFMVRNQLTLHVCGFTAIWD